MNDYQYRHENAVHLFIFQESGLNPFRALCDHLERIIVAEPPDARAIRYLLDLRLAEFQEPMYEVVAGLRGISIRYPNRPASALALVVRPHPLNRVLNVTLTLVSRKIDHFKVFEGDVFTSAFDWLKSFK